MHPEYPDNTDIIELKASEIKLVRDNIAKYQNNVCPICNKELDAPVLDHNHTKKTDGTGLIRGVLCRSCNVFLGKIENNCKRYGIQMNELPKVLINMAMYIKKEQYPLLHPTEVKKLKLKKSSYNKLKKYNKKLPKYTGNFTKELKKLYEKYNITPEFY